MSVRARILALHAGHASDAEIALFLGCGHWYVRQVLNRCATHGRCRNRMRSSEARAYAMAVAA